MSSRETVCLGEMVWPAVESALENGTRPAIVAVGSIEQHGPQLPLNTETLDGDDIARRNATEWGMPPPPPTIRHRCSGHHLEFPGTITVPPETLMDVIRSDYRSLDEHGFDTSSSTRPMMGTLGRSTP
jgi:creatinine amidohydrolase